MLIAQTARRLARLISNAHACAAAVFLAMTLACPLPACAQTNEPPSSQQIQNWVEQLDDDRFAVREVAQRQLSRHLSSILPSLIELAESPQSKSSDALLQFLGFVSQDALSEQGKTAYESLNRIAAERTTQKAILAQKILESVSVQMREQALDRLERVGVVVADRHLSVLTQLRDVKNALVIDDRFLGTQDDLAMLPWLFDVQFVKLEGTLVTRQMVEYVVKMPQLRSLQIIETNLQSQDLRPLISAPDMDLIEILYSPVDDQAIDILAQVPIFGDLQLFGTEVSAAGAESLIEKIETANVFVGRGGFLGITCEPSSLVIQESIPEGPASKAGIRMYDKLKKINGVPIQNFEDLRKQLAKSAAGESVLVEYDRPIISMRPIDPDPENRNRNPGRTLRQQLDGYETRQVDVTLGKRPSNMNP
ncbi:MAG: PDZ domain-containing protein [Planctomycetota bacterium]|nr:PDZ domain-containing protein [Planctomycetota bacterium]